MNIIHQCFVISERIIAGDYMLKKKKCEESNEGGIRVNYNSNNMNEEIWSLE